MLKHKNWLLLFIAGVFLITGCAIPAAVAVGSAVGAGSGTYFWVNGDLKTDYYYSFDNVWAACEKTVADMRGLGVEPKKEIGTGTIYTVINNEKVYFTLQYKSKNITTVSVRVGMLGNKVASQLLHDKVGDNIIKK